MFIRKAQLEGKDWRLGLHRCLTGSHLLEFERVGRFANLWYFLRAWGSGKAEHCHLASYCHADGSPPPSWSGRERERENEQSWWEKPVLFTQLYNLFISGLGVDWIFKLIIIGKKRLPTSQLTIDILEIFKAGLSVERAIKFLVHMTRDWRVCNLLASLRRAFDLQTQVLTQFHLLGSKGRNQALCASLLISYMMWPAPDTIEVPFFPGIDGDWMLSYFITHLIFRVKNP